MDITERMSTVKNEKFKKILTWQRTITKLIICNSKFCLCSFPNFSFFVANWDFWGLYKCYFARAEWSLLKTEYFVWSSLFVAQHFLSVSITSMTHPSTEAGRGRVCGDSESNQMFCYVIFVLALENMRGKKNLNFTPPHCSRCVVHSSILKLTLCHDRTKISPTESTNVGKSQRGSIIYSAFVSWNLYIGENRKPTNHPNSLYKMYIGVSF
jgi:hypothetical protein